MKLYVLRTIYTILDAIRITKQNKKKLFSVTVLLGSAGPKCTVMVDLEETLIESICLPTHVCSVHSVMFNTLIPSIIWKR